MVVGLELYTCCKNNIRCTINGKIIDATEEKALENSNNCKLYITKISHLNVDRPL